MSAVRLCFIRPLSPPCCPPPQGADWLREPKWDGFRFQVTKNGSTARFYSRHGADYTERLAGMRKASADLPADTAIIDGELCLVDLRGAAHFWRLMSQMRTRCRMRGSSTSPVRCRSTYRRTRHLNRLCVLPWAHRVMATTATD